MARRPILVAQHRSQNHGLGNRGAGVAGNSPSKTRDREIFSASLFANLERDVHRNADAGMVAVVHVIPVVHVIHINVVSLVPRPFPVFRPRINHTEPEAAVLEPRVSAYDQDWGAAHAKPVSTAKMRAEAIVWNAVASVSSTFAPAAMFMFPMLGAMALPNLSRFGAPVCGPASLAPVIFSTIAPMISPVITPIIAPMRLRRMLPVLVVVFGTLLPVLALVVVLVVSPVVLPLMVVAPVLVRVLVRASVFLFVLVAVLSARGSGGTQRQN